jgi:hypothetical protein
MIGVFDRPVVLERSLFRAAFCTDSAQNVAPNSDHSGWRVQSGAGAPVWARASGAR